MSGMLCSRRSQGDMARLGINVRVPAEVGQGGLSMPRKWKMAGDPRLAGRLVEIRHARRGHSFTRTMEQLQSKLISGSLSTMMLLDDDAARGNCGVFKFSKSYGIELAPLQSA